MSEKARELSPEEKLWAVKEYLSGKGSTYSIVQFLLHPKSVSTSSKKSVNVFLSILALHHTMPL